MKSNNKLQNLQPGDIVLVHLNTKYYARVISVEQRFYTKEDEEEFGSRYGENVFEGERYGDLVTFEKICGLDFSPTKRKYTNTYDEGWMTKVDRTVLLETIEKRKNQMVNFLESFSGKDNSL